MTRRSSLAVLMLALVVSTALPSTTLAGRREAAPAPRVAADSISPTVDLGQYAVNGTVRAAVVDQSTGNTYLGGNFSRVGVRTGTVAVVDPPDVSDGTPRAGPEILGTVTASIADDNPADPGVFVFGRITAINGAAVTSHPVYRLHRVGGVWVLDSGWTISGDCVTSSDPFMVGMNWIATPTQLVGGGFAGPGSQGGSPTGLTIIDRATGRMRVLGGHGCAAADTILPATPGLPNLSGCAAMTYCYAVAFNLAFDVTTGVVLVSYGYVIGDADATTYAGLAAYDLNPVSGGRLWTRALHNGALSEAGRAPFTAGLGSLPGMFLVRGRFPLDASVDDSDVSHLLLVNASDGSIVQRWNAGGEQDLVTGVVTGPATVCETTGGSDQASMARRGGEAWGWVGGPLCHYSLASGQLQSARVGSLSIDRGLAETLPEALYTAAGGDDYLIGSNAAVDLTTASLTSWNADPAMDPDAHWPSVSVVADSIVIAGDFRFVGGASSVGIAAFDPTMAPLAGFSSPIVTPQPQQGVNALAVSQGRLLVGGTFLGDSPDKSLLAVDEATGARDAWQPDAHHPTTVDTIVVAPDGGFWVGGASDWTDNAIALQHYAALDAGGTLLAAPAIGCLTARVINGGASEPVCGPDGTNPARVRTVLLDDAGRLIVAGAFGSIDGTTRRGLAMLDPSGAVTAWDPDLLSVIPIPSDGGLDELAPYSLMILGDRLVVGGAFRYLRPNPSGGYFDMVISPLLVFSMTSGTLLRPTDPDRTPWFPMNGWWQTGWSMAHTDAGLAVAFGQPGMGIFDATTLDFDAAASGPFFDETWMPTTTDSGIFALAVPYGVGPSLATADGAATPSPRLNIATPTSQKLVMAGVIPRWKNRVAGNVVRATVGADITPPTTTAPRPVAPTGRTVSPTAVPARLVWTGADPHGSGVARYIVQRSVAGGAWATVSSTLRSPTLDVSLSPGVRYQFRAKAVDYAGNSGSGWAYGTAFTARIVQQTSTAVRFSTGWSTVSNAAYLGGTAKGRSVIGAAASFTFSGRAVGFVTTVGPLRGRVKVYVDGTYARTVDLYATTNRYRTLAFSWGWSAIGTHTIRLVLAGPSSRPRVDVDAFVVYG
jgi:hypothetical protein